MGVFVLQLVVITADVTLMYHCFNFQRINNGKLIQVNFYHIKYK